MTTPMSSVRYMTVQLAKAETILDKAIAQQASGRNYVKPLLSGVIGKGQQFYVPVGMLRWVFTGYPNGAFPCSQ